MTRLVEQRGLAASWALPLAVPVVVVLVVVERVWRLSETHLPVAARPVTPPASQPANGIPAPGLKKCGAISTGSPIKLAISWACCFSASGVRGFAYLLPKWYTI